MQKNLPFVFRKRNYTILICAILVLIAGYFLMAYNFNSPETDYTVRYSFTKITLAPIVLLLGYALLVVSIFYKSPEKDNE